MIQPTYARDPYLLIPVPATPNGALHLGHIAGPYLRMDILARRLRQHGTQVALFTGTDCHDSYVLLKAAQENISPETVCRNFHADIATDLKLMNIRVDGYVDTLEGEGRALQERYTRESVKELLTTGNAIIRSENIMFDAVSNEAIVGYRIIGTCPSCGKSCSSYFCEGCGAHFRPEEIVDAIPRNPNIKTVMRSVQNIFLRIADPKAHLKCLHDMGIPDNVCEIVERFLAVPENQFRLTIPIPWGLRWSPDPGNCPRAIFEVLWEMFTYGDIHAEQVGLLQPAWRKDSGTKIVVSFGVDNTIPILIGGVGVFSALAATKPPEHALVNFFMNLEGKKFSTSSNHALWVSDIVSLLDGNIDMLRYYLCMISPDQGVTNFSLDEFVNLVNQTLGQEAMGVIRTMVRSAYAACCARVITTDSVWINRYNEAVVSQDKNLQPSRVLLQPVAEKIKNWIDLAHHNSLTGADAYWWSKAFANLAYPIMPQLTCAIWQTLGHSGEPHFSAFYEIPPVGSLDLFETLLTPYLSMTKLNALLFPFSHAMKKEVA